MVVIDLGEVRDGPLPDEPPPRSRTRPVRRPLWTALVALVVAAGLAADGPAPARIASVLPGSPTGQVFFADDLILVVSPVSGPGSPREVVAYPLPEHPTGAAQRPEPRWRTPLPITGDLWRAQTSHGSILFTSSSDDHPIGETTMLDARTGRLGWQLPGAGEVDGAGRLLLADSPYLPDRTVRAVDVVSGRTVWSAPAPDKGVLHHRRPGAVDQVVLAGPDGAVEVRDAATGEVRHRADLGPLDVDAPLQVIGDLLVHVDRRAATMTARDLDGLGRRWSVPLPWAVSYVDDCGALVCAVPESGGGLQAFDATTGALRWTSAESETLVTRWWGGPHRADRLLVLSRRAGPTTFAVLDAATGRQLAQLDAGQLVPPADPGGPFFGLRRTADDRLVVVELDLAVARTRTVDVIPGAAGDCLTGPDLTLVCRRPDRSSFGVWRLPA